VIGRLRGRLVRKSPPALIVDVGGVGYELEAPMSTFYRLPELGSEVELHTHLVVREDAHLLYGFATEEERRLFRDLLRVTGIGPKIGLALLSGIDVPTFLACVEAQDVDALVRIPGIGRKTAERLVIEMRDRLKAWAPLPAAEGSGDAPPVTPSAHSEAFSALIALGYKPPEVLRLLKAVDPSVTSTEEMIRHALRSAASA
jgi:Holliday junction DNA helicase RuvA